MKLGFIILAHNQPGAVRRLVGVLAGAGHQVVVHFDKGAPAAQRDEVRALAQEHPALVRVVSKVHCVWGEWSLVEAVLVALREFERAPEKPDYIHLMSGADFPIRPIADLQEFLRRNSDKDFIECCDITQRRWVKGGLSMERFRFFFPVNFRSSRRTFDRIVRWHRKLKIRRKIPLAMTPHMGSQWWTLRWSTCAKILDFLRKNPRVIRYFRSTWIPDEAFFQTVLAHLIPRREIADLQLTLHHLTPTGRPYVIYPDHLPLVRKLPHFFARKVAPAALDTLWESARSRTSPIPRPSQLARVRDHVRNAIDRNYEQSALVPGHPHGTVPARMAKPVVVFLTENSAASAQVRAHARSHPRTVWFGNPFAPDSIDLTVDALSRTGLTRGMTTVRENFPEQFVDTLAASACDNAITAWVVQAGEDSCYPAGVGRIPGAHYVRTSPDPSATHALPVHTRFIQPRAAYHLLEEIAASQLTHIAAMNGSTETHPNAPWLEVHTFGRIGNYFHLDATVHVNSDTPVELEFVLPGCPTAIRPESSFVRKQTAGPLRILHLFWANDGASIVISDHTPALAMAASASGFSPRPFPLHRLTEVSTDDLTSLLDDFGAQDAWLDRMSLESVSLAPVSSRFDYLAHALKKTAAKPTTEQLTSLVARHDSSFSIFPLPSLLNEEDSAARLEQFIDGLPVEDIDFDTLINATRLLAGHDLPTACRFALRVILSRPPVRRNILAALQPCLPLESRWWSLSLGQNDQLGAEQVADALNCAGTSAADQGLLDLAELCLQAARRIDPTAQSTAWNLGLLLAARSRAADALDAFHAIRRHYSTQSLSTRWPSRGHSAWPSSPWPADGYTLPEGIASWPRISIVTPSYNQGQYIEETILSILHQNYPNLQYIVIDANSTDDTHAVLERYRDRIDHLVIEPDDGQTQAINKGFRLADGEIVAWLNSDDMYGPGTLHQIALHWLQSGADVLAGICAEHRDHSFQVINKPSASDRDFNTAQLARIFPYWFSGMYFFQPEVFFTKSLLDRVGPLDESLDYAMDYDLWIRFAKDGARLEVIDWPCAFFRLHDAQKTTQSIACIAEQCAVRNRHHPLEPREERKHQIRRQLAALRSKKQLTLPILGPYFESEIQQAASSQKPPDGLIFPTSADDPILATADAVIVLIGSRRLEIPLLRQLRADRPGLLVIGWFLDHERDPHANHEAAQLVDLIIPTSAQTGDYLRNDSAMMGAPTPFPASLEPDDCIAMIHSNHPANDAAVSNVPLPSSGTNINSPLES